MILASSSPNPPSLLLLPPPSQNRRLLLLIPPAFSISLLLLPHIPSASSRGLFQMPPAHLNNRFFLVRAGESFYDRMGVLNTNPVTKTSVDSGLSPEGKQQAVRAAVELERLGACSESCWIWPSITQRAYQAAEIIASVNGIDRRFHL